jgi:para-aminobenzoate synthetase/4-amino-4-deoxychorismate lyase
VTSAGRGADDRGGGTGAGGGRGGEIGRGGPFAEGTSRSSLLAAGECLVATMAVVPGVGIVHAHHHLDRLAGSAARLGIAVRTGDWAGCLRCAARRAAARSGGPLRLRLLVDGQGRPDVDIGPLAGWSGRSVVLAVDDEPIDGEDRRWRHKTTARQAFVERIARHPDADDVILVNGQGQVTETTTASLLVRRHGRWVTPPVSSGCLPGVGRRVLLQRGVVSVAPVTVADLFRADAVAVVSSLRGWRVASVVRRTR